MTYTCAAEGCGAEIEWGGHRWHHNTDWVYHCANVPGHAHLLGTNSLAHPAGGTNTTPPEELERDVKKVTMEDLRQGWWAESSLAPLGTETKCPNGETHKINSHVRERDTGDGHGLYEIDEFCSRCGESLTKEGA